MSLHDFGFFMSATRLQTATNSLRSLLDLRGAIPSFIHITDGKTHEVNVLEELIIEPGAHYLPDRGYLDFGRLFAIHHAQAFFVTRAKSNTKFKVVVRDEESGKRVMFLTNNFALRPDLIAQLYRQHWQVERFFKWIKQHLRIKTFLGTSENAMKTQIWIAVCTYELIAIVKKRLKPSHSRYEILQIQSLTMLETIPINQLLPNPSTNSAPPIKPIQGVFL